MRAVRPMFCIITLAFVHLQVLAIQGTLVQSRHAQVELLSNQTATAAGQIVLGVHFTLENGWHIYWENPGDSGQPPAFTWNLPAGFRAGKIQWPHPERLQTSSIIVDYGYRDDVLLMVALHLPAEWNAGAKADIALDAKWLICREICLPDHAHLRLSLSASETNSRRVARLFARAKAALPQPWPKQWKVTAESGNDDFVLTIVSRKSFSSAEFFPLDSGQVENAAKQQVQSTSNGARLILKKSDLLLKPVSRLRGILVIPGLGVYRVNAPVAVK